MICALPDDQFEGHRDFGKSVYTGGSYMDGLNDGRGADYHESFLNETVFDHEGMVGKYSSRFKECKYYENSEAVEMWKKKLSYEEQQKQLFNRFRGKWTNDNGDWFRIYEEEKYPLQYSLGEESGNEIHVFFRDGMYAIDNSISISYLGNGDCELSFVVLLAEDGQSFEYDGTVFYRE